MSLKLYRSVKALLSAVVLTSATCLSSLAAAISVADVDHQSITIWSQGVRLAGDIYTHKGLETTDKLPGILLVPGRGGSKQNLEDKYAPHFAAQSFVVLTFDFKSWGESDGPLVASEALEKTEDAAEALVKTTQIRKIVNPLSMSEDVRAALHYLGCEPQVMLNNLGIWGTSMGGGLALITAASDDRIRAYVDQMGPVNYQYNLKMLPDPQMRQLETLVARGQFPPFPGSSANSNPLLKGYPDWVTMKRFNPLPYADQLTAPTLIIDSQEEVLFETAQNGQLLHEKIKEGVESRYIAYPGGHYDMYKGENLKAARAEAIDWFLKYLK